MAVSTETMQPPVPPGSVMVTLKVARGAVGTVAQPGPAERGPEENGFDYVIDAVGSKLTRTAALSASYRSERSKKPGCPAITASDASLAK